MSTNDTSNFRDRLKNLQETPPAGAWESIAPLIAPAPLPWWQTPWAKIGLGASWVLLMVWVWPSDILPSWAVKHSQVQHLTVLDLYETKDVDFTKYQEATLAISSSNIEHTYSDIDSKTDLTQSLSKTTLNTKPATEKGKYNLPISSTNQNRNISELGSTTAFSDKDKASTLHTLQFGQTTVSDSSIVPDLLPKRPWQPFEHTFELPFYSGKKTILSQPPVQPQSKFSSRNFIGIQGGPLLTYGMVLPNTSDGEIITRLNNSAELSKERLGYSASAVFEHKGKKAWGYSAGISLHQIRHSSDYDFMSVAADSLICEYNNNGWQVTPYRYTKNNAVDMTYRMVSLDFKIQHTMRTGKMQGMWFVGANVNTLTFVKFQGRENGVQYSNSDTFATFNAALVSGWAWHFPILQNRSILKIEPSASMYAKAFSNEGFLFSLHPYTFQLNIGLLFGR